MSKRTRATSLQVDIAKRLSDTAGKTTYSHIARTLGTNHETVRRYLRGITAPSVHFLIRFSEMFRVDPGWLLTGRHPHFDGMDRSRSTEIRLVEPTPGALSPPDGSATARQDSPPNAPRRARRGGSTSPDGLAYPDEVTG